MPRGGVSEASKVAGRRGPVTMALAAEARARAMAAAFYHRASEERRTHDGRVALAKACLLEAIASGDEVAVEAYILLQREPPRFFRRGKR